ncbi:MAG: hypothetical protein KJO57_08265 [Deltaproteobacteria bacterium]|nr:hypothetical protein [Deltaproteobacteria bacterium]
MTTMNRISPFLFLAVAIAAAPACTDTNAATDAGADAATDAGPDAATDAGPDAAIDAGPDAATDAGVTERRIFRTDTTQNANLRGIDGADAICAAQALAAGLEGEFKAWLSTIASPVADRVTQGSGPYVLVDGTRVADDWSDLVDGSILAPIDLDAKGIARSGEIWTGTLATGASFLGSDCAAFTTDSMGVTGLCGASSATNATWTENITPACSTRLGLYCIEQ